MKHCSDNCPHLSITEKDQDMYKFQKPPHICRKYNEQLYHYGQHPNIQKCKECFEWPACRETGSEARKLNMIDRVVRLAKIKKEKVEK